MLVPVLGSLVREQVLLFIHVHGEGYAREISRYFDASLDSVQKQLKRLKKGSVLLCERKGRTLIYSFNREYPFLNELCRLLDRVSCSLKDTMHTGTPGRRIMQNRRTKRRVNVTVKKYG
ncbi:ArsR family transcriptional regulator [Candidatus Fermentibacteria bacterium]|nr:MAG: ArsR family transcriptional regulator [Candidatus Fermentibacteria bacterium]